MRYLALASLLIVGCESAEAVDLDRHENEIIMQLVSTPAITPVPVSSKHTRSECPTGGWVGDGTVRTRCLDCDPPYSQESAEAAPPFGRGVMVSSRELRSVIEPLLLDDVDRDEPVDTVLVSGPIAAVTSGGVRVAAQTTGRVVQGMRKAQPIRSIVRRLCRK